MAVLDRFLDLILAEVDFNQSLASHQNAILPTSDSMDMFHHLTLGRPYWDLLSVESFLRRNSIYTTEQAINAMFRRLDHDDDKQLSYAEFREALNSHLTYPHSYVPLIRETVIRSSPYRASPGLRSSVYASPY